MEWFNQFLQWMMQMFSQMMGGQQPTAQPTTQPPASTPQTAPIDPKLETIAEEMKKKIILHAKNAGINLSQASLDHAKSTLDVSTESLNATISSELAAARATNSPEKILEVERKIPALKRAWQEKIIELFPQHKEALTAYVNEKYPPNAPAQTQAAPNQPTQTQAAQPQTTQTTTPATPAKPQGVTPDVARQASQAAQTIKVIAGANPADRINLVGTSEKDVQLSFDDGIMGEGTKGEEATKDLLDFLKKHNAKATFFITTDTIDNPTKRELIKRMVREGHEVGLHSTNHDYTLADKPDSIIRKDVQDSKKFLTDLVREEFPNYNVALFRPPGGIVNERYQRILSEEGLAIAMWDLDTEDYKTKSGAALGADALAGIRAGRSNVLMHNADLPANDPRFPHKNDAFRGDGNELTVVQKLEAFVPQLRQEGYQFETLSEALRETGHGKIQGGTLIGSDNADQMLTDNTNYDHNKGFYKAGKGR
ncbi:MAG: polysaccharide deacetylase family protein [Alphaproteobacteria bacterium]|nr:MAG: polysaccharide deacetylase family protein [Alphaproteobacteria bacterium]TAF76239.1 MAG: polysaccharide deacetylase family protein [Alphaproteobacteria bacterium]